MQLYALNEPPKRLTAGAGRVVTGRLRASPLCYTSVMTDVASRELRNNTRELLNRVAAGEELTITVDGRPMAVLRPVGRRPRWMARDEFARRIVPRQADPGLREELASLAPDTTDDLPW